MQVWQQFEPPITLPLLLQLTAAESPTQVWQQYAPVLKHTHNLSDYLIFFENRFFIDWQPQPQTKLLCSVSRSLSQIFQCLRSIRIYV